MVMIADMPPTPPAVVQPAPHARAALGIWGDITALEALRLRMEGQGWTWVTALLGDQTPALFLWAPEDVTDAEVARLLADINAGRFGPLNGGYALIETPPRGPTQRPDDV